MPCGLGRNTARCRTTPSRRRLMRPGIRALSGLLSRFTSLCRAICREVSDPLMRRVRALEPRMARLWDAIKGIHCSRYLQNLVGWRVPTPPRRAEDSPPYQVYRGFANASAQLCRRKRIGLRRKERIGNITTNSAGGRGASARPLASPSGLGLRPRAT